MQRNTRDEVSLQVIPDRPRIALAHLLIDQRWASLPYWSHLYWLPVDQHMDTLKQLYGEQDTLRGLQCVENAANTSWCLVGLYPDQLFFQMTVHVVDSDPSPFLSAYLREISSMCTPPQRCWVTPRPMTWHVPSGTLRGIIDVTKNRNIGISAFCVIPNTTRVVYGTSRGDMFVIDIESHELVAKIPCHSGHVVCITVSKDGALIASCSIDHSVYLWNAKTCEQLCKALRGHTERVCSMAISDDSKYVASGSWDKTVRIWDVQRACSVGKPLEGHSDTVLTVAFSPTGQYLVSGSNDKSVRVWKIPSGHLVGTPLVGHNSDVICVCVSPDGRFILSASGDRTVRVWNLNYRQQLGEPLKFEDGVCHVSVSDDNHTVVSVCWNGAVSVWDMRSRKVAHKFNVHWKCLLYSSDVSVLFQKNCLVCCDNKNIYTFSLNQHITAPQPFNRCSLTYFTAAISADHSTVSLCLPERIKACVWHVNSNTANSITNPFLFKYGDNGIDLSRAGSLFLLRDCNWLHAWTLKGQNDCFDIPPGSIHTQHSESRNRWRKNASAQAWKCIASARVKLGMGTIEQANFDSTGKIIVQRSDGMVKHIVLQKKIRRSNWEFVEHGGWTEKTDFFTIPSWLSPFGDYMAGKTAEQVEKIPKWLLDCHDNKIYDIADNRVVATFSAKIVHHSWKEVNDNKKELVVVLDDARIYFCDVHVNQNPA